jgi:hypothetical protein
VIVADAVVFWSSGPTENADHEPLLPFSTIV